MKDEPDKNRAVGRNALWFFLTSVRPAVALICLVALCSGFGAVVPSVNVYHSWGFFLLLGLLSLNLLICSWRGFSGFGGCFRMSAGKRAFSRLGVPLVHLGVSIMIIGALLGAMLGFDADIHIVEGETVDEVPLVGKEKTINLGFSVRLDRFYMDFYDDGTPKTYRSDLTFMKEGRVIFQGPLFVNHPISLEGLRFCQSGYMTTGGDSGLTSARGGEDRYVSELRVTRDHGAGIVAAGAAVMMVGFVLVLFHILSMARKEKASHEDIGR